VDFFSRGWRRHLRARWRRRLPPHIQLYGPDNALLQDVKSANGFVHDVWLTAQAASSGTFTVLVSSTSTASGSYSVSLGEALEPIVVSAGHQGGPMQNGASNAGTIALGDVDVWRFTATAGDNLMLRMGSAAMAPWILLYGPSGALVQDAKSVNGFTHDVWMNLQATNSGTYTVMVSSTLAGGTGDYTLTLAQALESFVVSTGHQGGPMQNGAFNTGAIAPGEVDMWSFTANAGDNLMLRMGSSAMSPWILLYGPNGALVQDVKSVNGFTHDVWMTLQATNSGTYTVAVSSTFAGGAGDYNLTLAQAPEPFVVSAGDQGGPMQNGASNAGTITLGDADMWSFTANAGDNLILRAGAADMSPWLLLYGPTGALVQDLKSVNGFTHDVWMTLQATNSGTYTVVVSSTFAGGTGDYTLTLAQAPEPFVTSPGDQGGALTNGTPAAGTISLGDLDMWSFTAKAGDGLMLRAGAANMSPWLQLYGPSGALVEDVKSVNGFTHDVWMTVQATNAGTYTVVISSTFAGGTGDYTLTLAQALEPIVVQPGQAGGPLTNGVTNTATLNLGGMDVWSFYGTPGDSNVLRAAAPDFSPWLLLWGPDGKLVQDVKSANGFVHAIALSQVITNAGTYTVALGSTFPGQSGTYTLKESRVPPDLNVPDTQVIDELALLSASISAQDPDVPGKPLVFALLSGPPIMTLTHATTNATLTWQTTEADGPSTNPVVVTVTDSFDTKSYTRTNSFTVIVREVNKTPVLPTIGLQTVNELNLLTVNNSATEPDPKSTTTGYALINPPPGAQIDSNGVITWTPGQTQSPGTNTITTVVTNSNPFDLIHPQLLATNSFTVVVQEVNVPPTLHALQPQTVNEQTLLTVTNAATEGNIHSTTASYALITPPAGAQIDPTGVITWTPTQTESPSTNTITTVVLNSNPYDLLRPQLTGTNSFTVIVREVNLPPVLPAIATQTVKALNLLTVNNTATEPNIHSTTTAYGLINAPTGVNIDPNGVITWTPNQVQNPITNLITTVVTNTNPYDTSSPHLTATNSFTVVVQPLSPPVLQPIADQTLHFGTPLSVQAIATDPDRPAATLSFTLDPGAPTNLTINASSGAISWTPSEAQVGTHAVTVRVTDNGTPPLSATTTFNVTVTGQGSQLKLDHVTAAADQLTVQLSISADTGHTYELQKSTDLKTWNAVVQLILSTSPFTYIDPEPSANSLTFYRLRLVQ
jgi:Putative Ig domain